MQQVAFKKWGNSLALRISSVITNKLGITENTKADIEIKDDCIIIRPERNKYCYQLESLLSQITEENLHSKIHFGKPIGKELL
ncbi:AbrB/MazE/SpoVT family DNA-binding domain-containing protein [Pelistega suis]|uniref:AbrB/MazE/SpoVT family DNA-binding domain-containing protein n=1 Tax=Pelistega suis TaxID=1631957 RepID=UPI00211C8DE5|nr:PbsX family transcriptional regulator [Pelistega suis]MCQ9329079.1 PbsX family transcriptional regulator [Pelistega suis]